MASWIPVVVVLIAIVLFAAAKVFGGEHTKSPTMADDVVAEADAIEEAADAQLAVELAHVDADKEALADIEIIDDDAARLEALAKYGNRGRS